MTGKIEPNAKPLAPFTFNASAEYRWLTEQYFLKCGRGDPDEELSRRLVAYVNHIALQGDAPFDPIASLSADAEAEREAVRLQRAAQIRSSFTKEKADAELRAICENLSCGCEGGGWASPLWISGLEWGGGSSEPDGTSYIDFDEYENTCTAWLKPDRDAAARWLNAYRYNQYLVRFCTRLFGWQYEENVASGTLAERAAAKGLFMPNGVGAKLNLFPFSRQNNSQWKALHVRYQGVDLGRIVDLIQAGKFFDVNEYYKKAVEWRSSALLKRLYETTRDGSPKLVVGIGIGKKREFAEMFGALESEEMHLSDVTGISTAVYEIGHALDADGQAVPLRNCWLVVLPFFYGGSGSLSSYSVLDQTVRSIQAFLLEKGVPAFWADPKWSTPYDWTRAGKESVLFD